MIFLRDHMLQAGLRFQLTVSGRDSGDPREIIRVKPKLVNVIPPG